MTKILNITLRLFDSNTNTTTDNALSDEMKTYYSAYLIDNAQPNLVHDQFAQKHPIPQNGGKTIEFRKYSSLPKLLTPITEGVTPSGQKLSMSAISASVAQYGGFIELSDILLLTAIDNNLAQATKLLGSQAGRTLDTITREVLNGGTNVQYGASGKSARHKLTGGESSGNDYLTVDAIKRAVRYLKAMNAEKIDGDYVAIINQDNAYDLTNDSDWKYPHQYVNTENIYSGEIGRIGGCRFVETSESKIFHAPDLASDSRTLLVNKSGGYSGAVTSIAFDGGSVLADALVGRYIIIGDVQAKITANTASTMTFASTDFGTVADNAVIYPGEAGAKGRDVYSTLVMGSNAYGTTELAGGGLQHIIKQLGSGGASDPLNQRASCGWKASKVAKRLVEEYMVRIETCSSFNDIGAN